MIGRKISPPVRASTADVREPEKAIGYLADYDDDDHLA